MASVFTAPPGFRGRRAGEGERGCELPMLIWLWVKSRYPKCNPGKWNQGLEPAVPLSGLILTHTHLKIKPLRKSLALSLVSRLKHLAMPRLPTAALDMFMRECRGRIDKPCTA